MPSSSGSPEPHRLDWYRYFDGPIPGGPWPSLTTEEQDRVADGEPYCCRCGKPASSFEAYDAHIEPEGVDYPNAPKSRADAVREEEGTYNPDTNRFACDACYIAIGMPADNEAGGWRAP